MRSCDWCMSPGIFFFFSNHKCFLNQPGNKRGNTRAAPGAIMTWTGRWHQSPDQKAVGAWVKVRWRQSTRFFFLLCNLVIIKCFKHLILNISICALRWKTRDDSGCKVVSHLLIAFLWLLVFQIALFGQQGNTSEQVVALLQVQQQHTVTSDYVH